MSVPRPYHAAAGLSAWHLTDDLAEYEAALDSRESHAPVAAHETATLLNDHEAGLLGLVGASAARRPRTRDAVRPVDELKADAAWGREVETGVRKPVAKLAKTEG